MRHWPAGMTPAQAAGMFITYQTGYCALHHRARLQPGETLLVHAAASGVGTAAVQLGKAAGARVIGTAGGPRKCEAVAALGADEVIDYSQSDVVHAVRERTGGRGADVIFDPVGGDVFDASRRVVAFEGRILVIGFTSGRFADAPTNHVLVKGYSVVGVHWGRYVEQAPELVAEWQARAGRALGGPEDRPGGRGRAAAGRCAGRAAAAGRPGHRRQDRVIPLANPG